MTCQRPVAEQTSARGRFVTRENRRARDRGLRGGPVAGLLCLPLVLLSTHAQAAHVTVGPHGDYTSVEAAINGHTYSPGDTIEIAGGTFTVQSMLKVSGSGNSLAPVVVRGAGMGTTIIDGSALTDSKALWDLENNNRWWVFEDMTVSGMRGSQTNARGFFLVGCEDVTLQRLEVTDCWNGIMASGGAKRVTLQFSNIHHCGGLQGPAHNIYIWLHDAQYGACYKDRTRNLTFRYNWVENADIEGYEISLAGDGSGIQGETLFLGNIIIKSASSVQQTHLIRFENGRSGTFRLVHNTIVAQPANVVVSSIASTTTLENNIFFGGQSLWSSGDWSVGQNWLDNNLVVPDAFVGNLRGSTPGLAATWELAPGSPCVDAGTSASILPQFQWSAFGTPAGRTTRGTNPDLGAFEAQWSTGTTISPVTWSGFKCRFR